VRYTHKHTDYIIYIYIHTPRLYKKLLLDAFLIDFTALLLMHVNELVTNSIFVLVN